VRLTAAPQRARAAGQLPFPLASLCVETVIVAALAATGAASAAMTMTTASPMTLSECLTSSPFFSSWRVNLAPLERSHAHRTGGPGDCQYRASIKALSDAASGPVVARWP
jgi:hypothetical protein